MRKISSAICVLAAMFVIAPTSALCDSFGYSVSSSKVGANSSFDGRHSGIPGGVAESGIFRSMELPGMGGAKTDVLPGSKAMQRPIAGAFFFDESFQSQSGEARDRFNTGALVDLNGQRLVLLSASAQGRSAGKDGQFVFADKGIYRVSNELQKGRGIARTDTTALTVTPEPGSLFLLGTGLLGLALVLFWKAARRSTGS